MSVTSLIDGLTTVASVRVNSGLHIGGRWRASEDDSRFDVINPSTGQPIAAIADATTGDALAALDSAHVAQPSWGRTSARQRAEILRAAFEAVIRRRDEFAAVITAEMGRPLAQSLAEVAYGAEFLRWFAEQAAHIHGEYGPSPHGDFDIMTTRVPVGPCLLITPWNFPLAMGTRKIGAALAAGCTVIVKPASQTPLTMALLVEVLVDAGVPPGVVNFVPTSRSTASNSPCCTYYSFSISPPSSSLSRSQAGHADLARRSAR